MTWRSGGLSKRSAIPGFGREMAIFGIEDDPQAGWDHVSGYRTTAYVVSPFAKRASVVHTQYNTTSVLRTIEQILGLPPMNQFDASATPMFDCFTDTADVTPFDSVANNIPLDQMNPDPAANQRSAVARRRHCFVATEFRRGRSGSRGCVESNPLAGDERHVGSLSRRGPPASMMTKMNQRRFGNATGDESRTAGRNEPTPELMELRSQLSRRRPATSGVINSRLATSIIAASFRQGPGPPSGRGILRILPKLAAWQSFLRGLPHAGQRQRS